MSSIHINVNVRKGVEENHQKYVEAIAQFVSLADIVKVSDEDLLLQGLSADPQEQARVMLESMDNGMVVLTLGEDGAHFITHGVNVQQDIFTAEPFGDTVGAGDTFFSALLSQLLRDTSLTTEAQQESFAYALKFGSLAASINVSKIGCHPPSYNEVLNKLG